VERSGPANVCLLSSFSQRNRSWAMPDPGTRDFETSGSGLRQGSDFAPPPGSASDGGISGGGAENSGVAQQAGNMARNLGEQARSAMAEPGATAQELARRAREQASIATDAMYRQGAQAGEYLSRNINEYPLPALLIAGAIGYGLAYLIYTQWQGWSGTERRDRRSADC
jgi:hypothetical protein